MRASRACAKHRHHSPSGTPCALPEKLRRRRGDHTGRRARIAGCTWRHPQRGAAGS
ncbi:hypothetical protein STVIR_0434 [Streptomyces viridochromogenes Tue57]|uniref:Uncharacterized protein n=1 Tax=Streptomyces viridochromogenes Tue57 TaxID=1160705 RepID=L8PM90_STRVR|nr:hypothetical protein STVIR_0434 [Streptomyces viridochromogenes Tue57]